MENPGRQQNSGVGSAVIAYVQASGGADVRSSVKDSSSQEGKRKAGEGN